MSLDRLFHRLTPPGRSKEPMPIVNRNTRHVHFPDVPDEMVSCPAGCGQSLLRRISTFPSPIRYVHGTLVMETVQRQRVEYRINAGGVPLTYCPCCKQHCKQHLYGPLEGLKHG